MLSEMKQDNTLIAVTAGTPTAGGFTADKRQLAGKQHIDMGIAEEQAVAMISVVSTGCIRQDYLMFEDGDFDGVEFSDYDLIQNAELEMDDIDRN